MIDLRKLKNVEFKDEKLPIVLKGDKDYIVALRESREFQLTMKALAKL